MTKEEMQKRIKELGGLNPKTALIVSIEKWKGLPKYWDEIIKSNEVDYYPGTENCALCQQYNIACENCCLDCCETDSQYDRVEDAIQDEDKPEFMKARRNIIRRMQRALKKLEAEEK